MIPHVNKDNFKAEVLDATLPVIVDVYAPWCGPCGYMAPIFEACAQEYAQHYKFVQLNVDEARELAMQFRVTSIPTFLFFKDGTLKGKEMGTLEKEDMIQKAQAYFGE